MLHTLSTTLLPVLMIVAAASDVMSFRIPNTLTALIAILFFPMAWATGMPLDVFGYHVLAGFLFFVAGFAMFSFGLFGGGDAKMMAAGGLWFGTAQSVPFLIFTVQVGGLLAIAVLLWSLWHAKRDADGKRVWGQRPSVPYGFAIAIGAIFAFPNTWWMGGMA